MTMTTEDPGSPSESSSEDEGLDSDGSGPDSSEHPNDEENEWSEDSESSLASASSEAKSISEKVLFPAALPATSIRLMAESLGTGYNFTDQAAAALGHLAMNKLRRVVLIANQLRKHDQSQGLSVEHFSMAEKLIGTESFGHKSANLLADFKHVEKGVSILQDSRQIDLAATMMDSCEQSKPLLKLSTLSLSHHQLPNATLAPTLNSLDDKNCNNEGDNDDKVQEMKVCEAEDQLSDCSGSSSLNSFYYASEHETGGEGCVDKSGDPTSKVQKLRKRREILARGCRMSPSSFSRSSNLTKVASKLEKLVEKVLVLNEECLDNSAATTQVESTSKVNQDPPGAVVGIEWIDYMKVFMASFFHRTNELEIDEQVVEGVKSETPGKIFITKKSPNLQNGYSATKDSATLRSSRSQRCKMSRRLQTSSADFKLIIQDIISTGAFPVLGIVLNFFNDYMNEKFGTCDVEGLRRILAVIEATLKCPANTDTVYLYKIWTIMVRLNSIPPAFVLHQQIVQVFILLIKNGGKEFSVKVTVWTSEYITKTLNFVLTSCLHSFNLSLILFNFSVSLAIGLERIGIHLMVTLGWHTLVIEFLHALNYIKSQPKATEPPKSTSAQPMETGEPDSQCADNNKGTSGTFTPTISNEMNNESKTSPTPNHTPEIEETLMLFFRVFFNTYTDDFDVGEIQRIYQIVMISFGEKIVPYIAITIPDSCLPSRKRKGMKNGAVISGSIRRLQWKTKRIMVGKIDRRKQRDC